MHADVREILREVELCVVPVWKQYCEVLQASCREDGDHGLAGTICKTVVALRKVLDSWVEPTLTLQRGDERTRLE